MMRTAALCTNNQIPLPCLCASSKGNGGMAARRPWYGQSAYHVSCQGNGEKLSAKSNRQGVLPLFIFSFVKGGEMAPSILSSYAVNVAHFLHFFLIHGEEIGAGVKLLPVLAGKYAMAIDD